MSADVTLRPADPADLAQVGDVLVAARGAAAPHMPGFVRSDGEVRTWVRQWDLTERELWLAEIDTTVVGFAALTGSWLDDFYVAPPHQGSGIGTALLELVQALRPDGFCLWVFESNVPARDFYRRRGLLELERTDGAANEEHCPDIKLAWPGQQPLAFLRRLVDEVDDALGDVLARRAALTAAIQRVKPDLTRDAAREQQVVSRVASRVPLLGEPRVATIVDAVITESLDAAR